jgi:hypothetical protein
LAENGSAGSLPKKVAAIAAMVRFVMLIKAVFNHTHGDKRIL